MPKSPTVGYSVTNQNVATTTPQLGVGFVLARTTKGKFFDPSTVVKTLSQFKTLYGSEIVPDGTKSNVERALEMGAQVRVCRIGHLSESGMVDAVKGVIVAGKLQGNSYVSDTGTTLNMILTGYTENAITIKLKIQTKEFGGDISSVNGKFTEVFTLVGNRVVSTLYNTNTKANLTSMFQVSQNNVVAYKDGTVNSPLFVDTNILKNFIYNDDYLETSLVEVLVGAEKSTEITTIQDVLELLGKAQSVNNTTLAIQSSNATALTLAADTPLYYLGTVGNAGTIPALDDWKYGLDLMKDYFDFYLFFASHIHQHLDNTGTMGFHSAANSAAEILKEATYCVEIPKVNTKKSEIIAYRDEVGLSSKHVAYFAGGLKLYNSEGTLEDTDVLGTVLGLSSQASTQYAPWYSFAGQTRGIVGDAHGPVAMNYGSPGNYNELNDIAMASINIFVIKEVASGGKATMLWHNFTSTLLSDSERFLNVERLIYYFKKTLRPTLERYLEEPNTFATWNSLYLEIDPMLDSVKNRAGVSEYEWIGDQFATSFEELEVNNEKDVRQGIYRAKLRIKEVVAMQEIYVDIILDPSSGTVSIDQSN